MLPEFSFPTVMYGIEIVLKKLEVAVVTIRLDELPGCPQIDSLFRRFAVEVLVVGLRLVAGMVDDAVPMIRRRIERIELQWNTPGIDDVVIRSGRDDYREALSDRRSNTIENRLTGTLLHAKELVELVDFRPDLFLGL